MDESGRKRKQVCATFFLYNARTYVLTTYKDKTMTTTNTPQATTSAQQKVITTTILVAALGYFVDIYDLLLFLIIGKQSLAELYPEWAGQPILLEKFQHLLDLQMLGMLIGGVLWGVIGDKKGRLAVLFGSITLYSVANLLNAFVTNMTTYEILRFVAGVGLAGELGAGITLVAELMDKNKRRSGISFLYFTRAEYIQTDFSCSRI